jgi:hypothetical protein
MLFLVDQPKQIRVERMETNDGVTTRVRLGRVWKKDLELDDELTASLSPEELEEVEAFLSRLRQAESVRLRHQALTFPMVAREVMEYFENTADVIDRRLIAMAIMQSVRQLRKLEQSEKSPEAA